jgi:RHS repeat-associated protein
VATKSGYVYIYVSNESNLPVYFDNLNISHTPGPILETTDYYPFGLVMAGISNKALNGVAENRFKYNGKEEQRSEFSDESGLEWLDYGARLYDAQIGRWHVMDPMSESDTKTTPFAYAFNNPLSFIDPDGMFGEYYQKDGTYLGSDDEDDDLVYVAESKSTKSLRNGSLKITYKNSQKLSITHSEFRKQAATVYGESSAYLLNEVTDDLISEMFAIASVYLRNDNAFAADKEKAKEYLKQSPEKINKSEFKKTANAAVINAQLGGFDYSFGADAWDGREQGLFPPTNNDKSVQYKNKSFELHMNTMGWSISDEHYEKWKRNIGPSFKAPQEKVSPNNYGSYKNKGLIRLYSTAVYGGTIFWKTK